MTLQCAKGQVYSELQHACIAGAVQRPVEMLTENIFDNLVWLTSGAAFLIPVKLGFADLRLKNTALQSVSRI